MSGNSNLAVEYLRTTFLCSIYELKLMPIVCQVTKLTNLVNVLSKLALLSTAEYVFLVQVKFLCYANKDFS